MNYPNLLYLCPPRTTPLDIELFEDLQLTQLLPECPFDAALAPCDADELPARQEFFRALEDPSFRAHLAQLYKSVRRLRRLCKAFDNAACEPEKDVIFAACIDEMLLFSFTAAKDTGEGVLRSRFSEFFRTLTQSEDIVVLRTEAEGLLPRFSEICSYAICFHSKDLRIMHSGKESYLSRIKRCNQNLGLEELTLRPARIRTLSPQIIEALTKLDPAPFAAFAAFRKKNGALLSREILTYERPLGFYLEMASMLRRVREANIPLTYPTPAAERGIHITQAYDISLLAKNEKNIVPNDIDFSPEAPFFYLTGANGGGKTTYLRTVGIACTLFLLGAPIPASTANASIPSAVFTHFPHDERFDGSGRFVEEHRRVESILSRADKDALILLNETYSTTNEENAIRMTVSLAEQVFARGNFGLYITHQHALGQTEIPYLNVLVDQDDNNRRTFKIVRQKNSGGSYASDILRKYRLTPEALIERFGGGML